MVNDGHRHTNFLVCATGTFILGPLAIAFSEAGLPNSSSLALFLTYVLGLMTLAYMKPVHDKLNAWVARRFGAEVNHG